MTRSFSRILSALCVLWVLAGCSRSTEPAPDPIKAQHEALEKARGVEQTIMQSDQEQRKQADDASK